MMSDIYTCVAGNNEQLGTCSTCMYINNSFISIACTLIYPVLPCKKYLN